MNTGSPLINGAQEDHEGEYVLSLKDLFDVIRRRLWVIVLSALVVTGLTVAYSLLFQTPEYQASIKILIGQKQGESQSSFGSNVQGLQDVTATMAEAVSTGSVADSVIKQQKLSMSPGDLLKNLTAAQSSTTQFIDVSYKDPNPHSAAQIVNAVGKQFSEKVSQLSTGTNLTATVFESATVPQSPSSPKPLLYGALALVLGTILGIFLAFLAEYLDDSWRSPEEVEQVSGVPTLGVIPGFKITKSKRKG
ncbi:MAG: YveK family protein [Rubrobacteraceae bacterium]